MRKSFVMMFSIFCFFIFFESLYSQSQIEEKNKINLSREKTDEINKLIDNTPLKPVYVAHLAVEGEIGWNGYVGVGGRIDYLLFKNISINNGIGIGYWGFKLSGGLRYYWNYPLGIAFGLGATYNTGRTIGDDGHYANEHYITYTDSSGNKHNDYVLIDMDPVTAINTTVLYTKMLGYGPNGHGTIKLFIEVGYAYPLKKPRYHIQVNEDNDLNNDIKMSSKDKKEWDRNKPGGIILTIGAGVVI